jgi:hypothetical protein
VVQAVGAAVRPVQAEPIADGPAEHFGYGHAEGFCLHVNERILDGRDRLLDKAARRLTRARIEVRGDELDRARVLADQHLGELHDDDGQPLGAVALIVLRPADESRVRLDFQEREDAPAGVRM